MLKSFTLKERSWIYYDWANSAYSSIVTATILPVFYKGMTDAANVSKDRADSLISLAISIGSLIIALMAPILGNIANFKGFKVKMFKIFLGIGVASTFLLAVCPTWEWILAVYAVTIIGFHGSGLFYDAFLVEVTTEDRMDKVSTYGYALGYIGGSTIPLVLSIILIFFGGSVGIDASMGARLSFIITAIWWICFSYPMLKNIKQEYYIEIEPQIIRKSFRNLINTLKNIRRYKAVFLFLIAYFFYIDGVNTIIGIATVFGDTVGISSNFMIGVLLGIQILAFPFAILFGAAAKKFGTRTMIMTGICIYSVITFLGFMMKSQLEFLLLALLVSTSQGGIQALSRSYFGKMIPLEKANEFFGFYDIFGKFAAIMGPLLFSFCTYITENSRIGVLSLLLLFIIGGAIFWYSWRFSKPDSL
ncbi:MAG: MFS transporter [Clostridiales bacterium]|nr:MFS transporter [Clostridiales bacterium]